MLKQRAVMLKEPQDRMLNMPCSGMLPPDAETASRWRAPICWGRCEFGFHAKKPSIY